MALKNIKKFVKYGVGYLPLNKFKIMFESNGEIKDNSKCIFLEIIEKKLHMKYKIVWVVDDVKKYKNIYKHKNIYFIKKKLDGRKSPLYFYHSITSKYCCYTHVNLGHSQNNNQRKVFLTHGLSLKDTRGCYAEAEKNTDILTTSDFALELRCQTFMGGVSLMRVLGYPRNDKLYKPDKNTLKYVSKLECQKLILWMPTFKHMNSTKEMRNDFISNTKNDISLQTEEFMESLNSYLKKRNMKVIIKYHPSQDLSYVSTINYSNIIIKTNFLLEQDNVDLYSLMGLSDALITDFSSVYMDYLLVEKPIGFELNDLESYKNGRGFIVDNPLEYMPGNKITDKNKFFEFIEDVYKGNDRFKNERVKLKNKMHKYQDGKSTERVIELLDL